MDWKISTPGDIWQCLEVSGRRQLPEWGAGRGDREFDFYRAEMKMNKIVTGRIMAASGQGRSKKCSAGYKELSFGGSPTYYQEPQFCHFLVV